MKGSNEVRERSNEVRELVNEIERGWQELRDEVRRDQYHIYRHKEYAAELVSGLDPQITTRIPLPSAVPDADSFQIEGILRQSRSFHVNPKPGLGDRSPSVRRADRQELFFAHEWMDFDKDAAISDPTHRYQAVGPFAGWWLDCTGFALPKDEKNRDEYRKSYKPFRLSVLDPLTVSFLPDDNGQPTIAARHFDLPYIEIAKRYADEGDKDKNPLEILNKQFPYLRGARGQSVEMGEAWSKKATVWVVDDLSTICHYIDLKSARDGHERYEALTEEFPNPWGASSLTIVTGRYNADAIDLKDRYVGLIKDELAAQRQLDVMDSHSLSIAMTPSRYFEQLPEAIAKLVQEMGRSVPITFGENGVASVLGTMLQTKTMLDGQVQEIRATRTVDRDMSRPPPYLTNPDQTLVRGATAAAQLNAHETSNRAYDGARKSESSAIVATMKKLEHFICQGHLNKKGQPEAANEKIYIRLTGKEPTKKYSGGRKDEELDIGPEDFDEGDTLELTPTAGSQSQKAMEFELKDAQQQKGYLTRPQVLEVITEDVTGQMELLEEEERYQFQGAVVDTADDFALLEVLRMESAGPDGSGGMDLSALYLQAQAAMSPPLQGAGEGGGIGVNTTAPPPTSTPDTGVEG